jgi:hypothetical protein
MMTFCKEKLKIFNVGFVEKRNSIGEKVGNAIASESGSTKAPERIGEKRKAGEPVGERGVVRKGEGRMREEERGERIKEGEVVRGEKKRKLESERERGREKEKQTERIAPGSTFYATPNYLL